MRWRAILSGLFVLGLAVSGSVPGMAQDQATNVEGLDFIVLVDVSRSMYSSDADGLSPNGSDPQRMRWTAVKLLADLLSAEDRLMVQRFNEQCPPAYLDKDGQPYHRFTDGKPLSDATDFEPRLLDLSGQRKALEERIHRFTTTSDEKGRLDFGGTRIPGALKRSADLIGKRSPGRQMAVLLLTDGADLDFLELWKKTPDERLIRAWIEPTIRRFSPADLGNGESVPVYAFGLGLGQNPEGPAAEKLLLEIAQATGGHYARIDSSHDLLDQFRDLVWKLKQCWTRRVEIRGGLPEHHETTAMVAGLIDLGVLNYETLPRTEGSRNTRPPQVPVQFRWEGVSLAPQHRTGKDRSAYDYFFFGVPSLRDAAGRPAKSPFSDLRASATLHLAVKPGQNLQRLSLAKRTQDQLFELIAPGGSHRFQRYQHVPVQVRMARSSQFTPPQFSVKTRVALAGGADSEEISLTASPGDPLLFEGVLRLPELAKTRDAVDYYTLAVSVTGNAEPSHSLSGFQQDLAPRTIAVDNTLLLRKSMLVELSRDTPSVKIALETQVPVDADVPVNVEWVPPRRDKLLPASHFELSTGAGRLESPEVVLRKGQAIVNIGLRLEDLPPAGVDYEPGTLVITANGDTQLAPLRIPVKLRLDLAEITCDSKLVSIVAGPDPAGSPPLTFSLARPSKLPIQALRASLRPKSPGDKLPPASELWIQPRGAPASDAGRRQEIDFTLDDVLQVYAHVTRSGQNERQDYLLAIAGPGAASIEVPVQVQVNPPVLEVASSEVTVPIARGQRGVATFRVRLKGLLDDSEKLFIAGLGESNAVEAIRAGGEASMRFPASAPDEELPLVLATSENPEEYAELAVGLDVPADAEFGTYRIPLSIKGKEIEGTPVTVLVEVDEFQLSAGPEGQDLSAPYRCLQFFGHAMHRTVHVRSARGAALSPDDVRVSLVGPFSDETGDVQPMPAFQVEPKDDSLLVHLNFGSVENGHPGLPYKLRVFVESKTRQRNPASLEVHVWHCYPLHFLEGTTGTAER